MAKVASKTILSVFLLAAMILIIVGTSLANAPQILGIALAIPLFISALSVIPMPSFGVFVFLYTTFYVRISGIGLQLGGQGNIIDLLWGTFVLVVVFYHFRSRQTRISVPSGPFLITLALMIPYLLIAFILPIAGALAYSNPWTHGVYGIRFIQYASFAIVPYLLAKRFGHKIVFKTFINALGVSSLFHLANATIQSLVLAGQIPNSFNIIDSFTRKMLNPDLYIHTGRTTGMLANPNQFGVLGSFFLLTSILFLIFDRPRVFSYILLAVGVLSIAFSGSRSALVGTALGGFFIATIPLLQASTKRTTFYKSLLIAFGAASGITASLLILPNRLFDRFKAFGRIFSGGFSAEVNVAARLNNWATHLDNFQGSYPLGTWVAPSYAIGLAVDNFYLQLFIQGTFIFVILFTLFIIGSLFLAYQGFKSSPAPETRLSAIMLVAITGVLAGSAIGVVSFSYIFMIVIQFTLIGLNFAVLNRSERLANNQV